VICTRSVIIPTNCVRVFVCAAITQPIGGDDRQALIWDLTSMPKPITGTLTGLLHLHAHPHCHQRPTLPLSYAVALLHAYAYIAHLLLLFCNRAHISI
jgi:hypothetical protein